MYDGGADMKDLRFTLTVQQLATERGNNILLPLRDWQIAELNKVGRSILGAQCLLTSWLHPPSEHRGGKYCNASWDDVYCWPATPAGETVFRSCHETFMLTQPVFATSAVGHAYRVCLQNATWLWGNWTNYTECAHSYQHFLRTSEEEDALVARSQYILFIGSILSLLCLIPAVIIFQCYRCLRCDRTQILKQLLLALLLRYSLLLVITEPAIFGNSINYRSLDVICKAVLSTYLYATVASVNWMFVQGIYINGKLISNVHDGAAPFKMYYCVGWVFPLVIMVIYGTIMEVNHPIKCWNGYSRMSEIWIVALPIFIVLLVNLMLLVKIVWTLVGSIKNRVLTTDAGQIRRAAISMMFLVPLLGVSNLLFIYNPGGTFHKYYITANALVGSTQGVYVAVGYCFLSKDVQLAVRRSYKRFHARLNASRIQCVPDAIRVINTRQAEHVAQSRALESYICSVCQMHYDAIRLQLQNYLNLFNRELERNPLQNRVVVDRNTNPYPVLSLTSSSQYSGAYLCTLSDCEACRRKSFLVEMEYNLRRKSC